MSILRVLWTSREASVGGDADGLPVALAEPEDPDGGERENEDGGGGPDGIESPVRVAGVEENGHQDERDDGHHDGSPACVPDGMEADAEGDVAGVAEAVDGDEAEERLAGGEDLGEIHGAAAARAMAADPAKPATALLMPDFAKADLFKGVVLGGVLPRKTFSMGHAEEKRYYNECRSLTMPD